MKKALLLGAGLVSRPLVQYLLNNGFQVTVASRTVSKAEAIIGGHENGVAKTWTVDKKDELKSMVSEHDLAISLLPAAYHIEVAQACIATKTNMVTTSYVTPEMRALDGPAKETGVVILNESGVDPGIDHMSAMRIIHGVEAKGGKVVSFMSYCGGLPAPESNDNPWGYKFSWSPRAVLLASRNEAHYRRDGKQMDIPGPELFSHFWSLDVPDMGEFEAYPNRDSLGYIELYGLQGIPSMYRGTLRYKGWCDTLKKMADLGILNDEQKDWTGKTFADMTWSLLPEPYGGDLRGKTAEFLKIPVDSFILDRYEWLGLFSDEPLPLEKGSMLDILAVRMNEMMPYKEGEKDMIILHHQFKAEFPDHKEEITSTLIDYGIPGGDSSMARTVSLPAAVGARFIMEGKFDNPGVYIPVIPELYNPILDELETLDIKCKEEFKTV